jgi:hypothetical protein
MMGSLPRSVGLTLLYQTSPDQPYPWIVYVSLPSVCIGYLGRLDVIYMIFNNDSNLFILLEYIKFLIACSYLFLRA